MTNIQLAQTNDGGSSSNLNPKPDGTLQAPSGLNPEEVSPIRETPDTPEGEIGAIVISVGHGQHVAGASSQYGDEVKLAKQVTDKIVESLKKNNVTVYDYYDTTSKSQSVNLKSIVSFHKSKTRLLDVSVHLNADDDPTSNGTEVLTLKNEIAASALSATMAIAGGFKDRGVVTNKPKLAFWGTSDSAVLLEICFVSSKQDVEKLEKNMDKIASNLAFTLARLVSTAGLITKENWQGESIDERVSKMDITKMVNPIDGDGLSYSSDETSGFSSNYSDAGFSVVSDGGITVIDKLPLQETFAEPIYPDLVRPQVKEEDYVEVTDMLVKENEDKIQEDGYVEISLADMVQRGVDVAKLFFSYEDYTQRTTTDDTREHRFKSKYQNFHSPVNHKDPFPVDEKIEELQQHIPYMKIHRLWFSSPDEHTVMLAKTLMDLADKAEKRMTQAENNIATIYRNLFRLGSRVQINCVYYGGQSEFAKYQAIRCLHHDRVNDGQIMTLDQCLNCTRYEPVLGKTYDIENELGRSLEIINDDNQMGYQSMQTTIEQTRLEEKPTQDLTKQFIDIKKLTERTDKDKPFSEIWEEGFVMDWTPRPIEEQVPDVKYDDGAASKMLASNYKNVETVNDATGAGFNGNGIFYGPQTSSFYSILGYGGGTTSFATSYSDGFVGGANYTMLESNKETIAMIEANEKAMNNPKNTVAKSYYDNARKQAAGKVTNVLNNMAKYGYEKILLELSDKYGVDPILMLAIIAVESEGKPDAISPTNAHYGLMQTSKDKIGSLSTFKAMSTDTKIREGIRCGIEMYLEKEKAVKTKNIAIAVPAYNAGQGIIIGTKKTSNIYTPGLSEANRDTYTFDDIYTNLIRNAVGYYGEGKRKEVSEYYPKVHYSYIFLLEKGMDFGIKGTHDEIGFIVFPYKQEDMKNKTFYFARGKGTYKDINAQGNETSFVHSGMDIKCEMGAEIVAAAEGTVESITKETAKGNCVTLNHGKFKTIYAHLSEVDASVQIGQKIKKAAPIGKEGDSGQGTTKGHHLHFEIISDSGSLDPIEVFGFLKGQLSVTLESPIKFPV